MADYGTVLSILQRHYGGKTMLASMASETPFQVLISTVLSARSRDETTIVISKRLFKAYPTAEALRKAPIQRLESLVKSSGFYRVKAARIKEISQALVDRFDGVVPDDYERLLSLPGVGRKTAGCVLVYAFNKPSIPVDTHVHRISNRLGWVESRSPEKTEEALLRIVPEKYWLLVNEVFVLHGKNICKPIVPLCGRCPIDEHCEKRGVRQGIVQ
jgi:endonuclease III